MGRILGVTAVALLVAAPLYAQAQGALTYRCQTAEGKKYYGSAVPMQCAGRLVEVLNSGGMVIKRIDPQAEEKERLAKQMKEGKRPEFQSTQERDEERRNRALLATYTSVKDIDDARARALRDNATQAARFEQRIRELEQRRARYEKELANYKKDGKLNHTVEDNIKNTDLEIAAQQELLQAKQGEIPAINAKYDEDKKRYATATAAATTGVKK